MRESGLSFLRGKKTDCWSPNCLIAQKQIVLGSGVTRLVAASKRNSRADFPLKVEESVWVVQGSVGGVQGSAGGSSG